jgi:serine/threonine protein phosphatase PrpC
MFGRAKPITIRVFAKSDLGKTRDHNEDNFLIADLSKRDITAPVSEREY